jgi:hypothetical protein
MNTFDKFYQDQKISHSSILDESPMRLWYAWGFDNIESVEIELGFKRTKDNPKGKHILSLEYYVNKFEKRVRKKIRDKHKALKESDLRNSITEDDPHGRYWSRPIPKLLPFWQDEQFLQQLENRWNITTPHWPKEYRYKVQHPMLDEVRQQLTLLGLSAQKENT